MPIMHIRDFPAAEYPETLGGIAHPPTSLRIIGSLPPAHHRYLCVIGSRGYSPYGKEACEKLIAGLAGHPVCIVSGLALGIDSIAHEAALDAGLATVAFPGSGLGEDVLYPASKRALARRIVERGGALLSKFDDDCQAARWTFIVRNELMAALSHATLIIEAGAGSGTLTTAKYALNLHRDLLVVPGSIFSPLSVTPLAFMREGATAITSSEDILETLGLPTGNMTGQASLGLGGAAFTDEERRIIERVRSPLSRDELIRELDLPAGYVNAVLVELEMKGVIAEREGVLMAA